MVKVVDGGKGREIFDEGKRRVSMKTNLTTIWGAGSPIIWMLCHRMISAMQFIWFTDSSGLAGPNRVKSLHIVCECMRSQSHINSTAASRDDIVCEAAIVVLRIQPCTHFTCYEPRTVNLEASAMFGLVHGRARKKDKGPWWLLRLQCNWLPATRLSSILQKLLACVTVNTAFCNLQQKVDIKVCWRTNYARSCSVIFPSLRPFLSVRSRSSCWERP